MKTTSTHGSPPVILIGGDTNALSVGRSIGREGVKVYFLSPPDSPLIYSRFIQKIQLEDDSSSVEIWTKYLLGTESDSLRGAVLLACSDAGIELLNNNREELSKKFILDISNPDAQRCLLNKLETYQKAIEVGIPTPKFWLAQSLEQIQLQKNEYVYPLIVKPLYSHKFHAVFLDKYILVQDFQELMAAFTKVHEEGLDVMLVEKIPGPDDLLCSYYTYVDEKGDFLFDFTKRIIRRYPENKGEACFHVTDLNSEVRDLGVRMFSHVKLRGLGNVEFKRDLRDGKLKIIECNARFTAANCLLVASGYDLGKFVYHRLTGRTTESLKGKKYCVGLRLWNPVNDFKAFMELRNGGKLGTARWIKSLLHPFIFPYFRWYDPKPTIMIYARMLRNLGTRGWKKNIGAGNRSNS